MEEVIPLERLRTGQSAEIAHIVGPRDHVHRLEEFGLCCGARIHMFRAGKPCIVRMAGNKFCLRPDGRLNVFVKRNGTSCRRAN